MPAPSFPLPDRLVCIPETRHLLGGISRSKLWELRQHPDFPKAIALTPGKLAFRLSELMAWIDSRPVARFDPRGPRKAEPAEG